MYCRAVNPYPVSFPRNITPPEGYTHTYIQLGWHTIYMYSVYMYSIYPLLSVNCHWRGRKLSLGGLWGSDIAGKKPKF